MKKTLFKHIVHCTAFIAGLIVILLLVSPLFVRKDNFKASGIAGEKVKEILAENEETIDVLFIGDSECYSSFIPMQMWKDYGITSYNFGTYAQNLCQTKEYLIRTFTNQTPKIIVLEANAIYRKISWTDSITYKLGEVFSVFIYHDRWKSFAAGESTFKVNNTQNTNGKGYRYNTSVYAASTDGYMVKNNRVQKISNQNIRYIKEIKNICDEYGAELILVSVPSTKNWNYERHNGIEKFAEKLGVKYIDMNTITDDIPIDWSTDTRDQGDHLNYSGAVKVTSYIAKYIANLNLFDDKRAKPDYQDWNNYSDNFYELVNQ